LSCCTQTADLLNAQHIKSTITIELLHMLKVLGRLQRTQGTHMFARFHLHGDYQFWNQLESASQTQNRFDSYSASFRILHLGFVPARVGTPATTCQSCRCRSARTLSDDDLTTMNLDPSSSNTDFNVDIPRYGDVDCSHTLDNFVQAYNEFNAVL